MNGEEDKRLKLLEKARDHFLTHGYRGASLRNIARDAGLTTGALYHHFRGKDELFVDVCLHGFELMNRRFESAEKMTEGRPPAERIMAFFDAYVSFFFENRDYYELIERLQINREKLRIPEELMERIKQASSASLAPMVRAISAGGGDWSEKRTFEQVILFVAFAEGLFQCLRKGLLDRTGVPFGDVRSLILSKLPGLLEG
ncbi:MAG: TetR/AcrR family transcriptional regulator [Desulfatiglandales bacterium]